MRTGSYFEIQRQTLYAVEPSNLGGPLLHVSSSCSSADTVPCVVSCCRLRHHTSWPYRTRRRLRRGHKTRLFRTWSLGPHVVVPLSGMDKDEWAQHSKLRAAEMDIGKESVRELKWM